MQSAARIWPSQMIHESSQSHPCGPSNVWLSRGSAHVLSQTGTSEQQMPANPNCTDLSEFPPCTGIEWCLQTYCSELSAGWCHTSPPEILTPSSCSPVCSAKAWDTRLSSSRLSSRTRRVPLTPKSLCSSQLKFQKY